MWVDFEYADERLESSITNAALHLNLTKAAQSTNHQIDSGALVRHFRIVRRLLNQVLKYHDPLIETPFADRPRNNPRHLVVFSILMIQPV
jgi:hypothetical protein